MFVSSWHCGCAGEGSGQQSVECLFPALVTAAIRVTLRETCHGFPETASSRYSQLPPSPARSPTSSYPQLLPRCILVVVPSLASVAEAVCTAGELRGSDQAGVDRCEYSGRREMPVRPSTSFPRALSYLLTLSCHQQGTVAFRDRAQRSGRRIDQGDPRDRSPAYQPRPDPPVFLLPRLRSRINARSADEDGGSSVEAFLAGGRSSSIRRRKCAVALCSFSFLSYFRTHAVSPLQDGKAISTVYDAFIAATRAMGTGGGACVARCGERMTTSRRSRRRRRRRRRRRLERKARANIPIARRQECQARTL